MIKRFSVWLKEAGLVLGTRQDKFNADVVSDKKHDARSLDDEGYHKLSQTKSGHHIYHKGRGASEYIAHNPKTGHIDMHVDGYMRQHSNGMKTLKVATLSGRTGSKLKAHDFYHHLITKHDHILVGHEHTEGGARVWSKLAKKRDINVHGWDEKKSIPLDINQHDREETHSSDPKDPTYNMHLIAHKKVGK